ncbi:hypothetical protein AV530_012659 [Patagioenas fasciata monilis]|uniref:Uncharacterized protein n=1 Tax=Patagioenas fasciata monilis TaxID=372326 RepID=A0A1V4JBW6_PATFA|nr:hypothetical protein AV530_012659 [Patagioenas fasciata monilis]
MTPTVKLSPSESASRGKGAGLPAACGEGGHGPGGPERWEPASFFRGSFQEREVILCVYSLWRLMHQWSGGIVNDR